jgi:hypothetical protein
LITKVTSIKPVSQNVIRVTFNQSIKGIPELLDPNIYNFSEDLEATGVMILGSEVLDIITTEQEIDKRYSLRIDLND